MNSTPNPPELANSTDRILAALKEACEIGPARADEPVRKPEGRAAFHPSDQQSRPAVQGRQSSHVKRLVGLAVAICVCVAAAVTWHSYSGAQPKAGNAGVVAADAVLPQQPPLQATTQPVPPQADPMSSELSQRYQKTADDLASAEEQIRQLKAVQERIDRDNADLAERLKATQEEMARNNAALAEQLRTALAQMERDNAALAEQLKAAQTQMASDNASAVEQLKASQEQIARLVAQTTEPGVRPKTPVPSPRPATAQASKPLPTARPPQARAQPPAFNFLQRR
jgi:hypothetical protein